MAWGIGAVRRPSASKPRSTRRPCAKVGSGGMGYGALAGRLHLKVYNRGAPVALCDILPVLENMGLQAMSEMPYEVRPAGKDPVWIHDFHLMLVPELLRRREPRTRRRELGADRVSSSASECTRVRDFEHAAELTSAETLLALDRGRDTRASRATIETSRGPHDHGDVRREHEQPHQERHGSRQRHPARTAERRCTERE